MTPFAAKVLACLKKIPRGKVATYGQIAALAGKPQGARGVAWLLHSSSRKHALPWQRVLGAGGKISFPWESEAHGEQRRRLENEGVTFLANGKVDLAKHAWKRRSGIGKPPARRRKGTKSARR